MQSMWVWPLVWDLRSHMLQSNQARELQLLSQWTTVRESVSHSEDPTCQHSERNKERKKSRKKERNEIKKEGRKRQARKYNQGRKKEG